MRQEIAAMFLPFPEQGHAHVVPELGTIWCLGRGYPVFMQCHVHVAVILYDTTNGQYRP